MHRSIIRPDLLNNTVCNPGMRCVDAALLLLAGLLLTTPAYSDDYSGSSEDLTPIPIEQLVEMEVVSATRLARQVSDAPSAVAVVTAQDIKDYGYHTLSDILNSMRGLYITHDHAFDYLGGRGFSRPGDYAGRVLLLIDGYASNDNIYNQIYIDNSGLLDTELIERVEYVPGTGSVLYGNNAYFGIISVTTKKGRAFNGVQASGEMYSDSGRKARMTFGKSLENGADVLLSVSGTNSDGDKALFFPEYNSPATNNGVANNLDYEQSRRLFAKLSFENWRIEAGYVGRRKAIPTGANGVPFNAYNLFRDSNGFISANYDADLGATLKASTHAYSGYYLDHGIYAFAVGTEHAFNRGQWWGIDQKLVYTGLADHKLIFGAEYRDDFAFDFSNLLTSFSDSRKTFSLYAQDEITLNKQWVLNVGARYDDTDDVSGNISPRVALIYSPTAQTTWKAAYSSAFRLPAAIEKFNVSDSQIANPSLQSEKVTTVELVLKHEFSPNFSLTGSLYQYRTDDLITSVDLPSGFEQFQNTGATHTRGLEVELERIWSSDVRLRTSFAYQDAEDMQGQTAVNAPKELAKLNLTFPLFNRWMRTGLEIQYTGSRLTELRRELGSYTVANINLTSDRILPNLTVSATLRNIFDKHFMAVAPSGMAQDALEMEGRNFWIQLGYDFK